MAQSPTSPLVRLVVPLVLALMLGGLAYLLFRPSSKPAATPTPPTPSATGSAPGGLAKTELKDAPPSLGTLSTKPQGSGGAFASIGGLKKDATDKDYLLQIDFNSLGAGIGKLQLGAHRQSIEPDSPPEVLQETLTQPESNLSVVPFGMIVTLPLLWRR